MLFTVIGSIPSFALQITDFNRSGDAVEKFSRFEVSFKLDEEFPNPFDQAEVDIEAVFISPAGKSRQVFAFYTRDYDELEKDIEFSKDGERWRKWRLRRYIPQGESYWTARFTPDRVGRYKYYIQVKTPLGETRYPPSGELEFECVESGSRGFIKPDPNNRYYLRFDNGESYWGVGFNGVNTMGDFHQGNVRSFDVMRKSAVYGANIMHIDLAQGDYLEWSEGSKLGFPYYDDYRGLGRYNLQVASQIDRAIEMAEELGVYLRFTLFHFTDFLDHYDGFAKTPGFKAGPYHKSQGGPCENPNDFFTNAEAWRYQQRLFRYIIARWGYSPIILWWELFCEVNFASDSKPRDYGMWHKKTLEYFRRYDPNHMVTTSVAKTAGHWKIFEKLDFDVNTFHCYPNLEKDRPGQTVENLMFYQQLLRPLGKPVIPGEFGSIARFGIAKLLKMSEDTTGIHLHNQLWASLMLGTASCAMHWHWEYYLDKYDLYYHLQGIANFVRGEDFGRVNYVGEEMISLKCGEKEIRYVDTYIPTPEEKAQGMRGRAFYSNKTVDEAGAFGLISPERALVWIFDRGNNYISLNPSPQIRDVKLKVRGMNDAPVRIEYWNTTEGKVVHRESAKVKGGKINLKLRPFIGDVALKIIKD